MSSIDFTHPLIIKDSQRGCRGRIVSYRNVIVGSSVSPILLTTLLKVRSELKDFLALHPENEEIPSSDLANYLVLLSHVLGTEINQLISILRYASPQQLGDGIRLAALCSIKRTVVFVRCLKSLREENEGPEMLSMGIAPSQERNDIEVPHYKSKVEDTDKDIAAYVEADHYKGIIDDYQYIEVMQKMLTPEEFLGALKYTIQGYLMRLGKKDDSRQDALKAGWYTNFMAAWLINDKKFTRVDEFENIIKSFRGK